MVKKLINMKNSSEKSANVSTTIRIPKKVFEKIELEATTQDSNISNLINSILRKYVAWDRFVGDIGYMHMPKAFLRSMFEKITKEDMEKLATTTGHSRMRDAILFINGKVDLDGTINVIKLWLSASEIPIRIIRDSESVEFIVPHNLGQKWSMYFAIILKTIFDELNLSLKKEDLEEHTVTIIFSINTNTSNKKKS